MTQPQKPSARTRVTLGEESWVFDESTFDLNDAFMLKAETGLTMPAMLRGVSDLDPDCLRAFLWFNRRKVGEQIALSQIQPFALLSLTLENIPDPEPVTNEPDPMTGAESTI